MSIQIENLSAEFSTGQRPDGEWFALGTVREAGTRFDGFPCIIVGTGASRHDAIAQLTAKLEHSARTRAAQ